MNIEKMKKTAYRCFVDNNILVSQSFQDYLDTTHLERHYIRKACKLVQLNWKYRICRQTSIETKLSALTMPEFEAETRLPIENVVAKLEQYDWISFDIFDTLIFRAVEKPRDVFRILEAKWNIIGFAGFREEAEKKAREKDPEATIYDIYDILATELAIDKEAGIALELQTEKDVCYANPYMKKIVEQLQSKGKKIVVTSDMYLPKCLMQELLESCGYKGILDIFVSCDIKASKYEGMLQQRVQKQLGIQETFVHVGDNECTDIEGSKKAGWRTFYYKNIEQIGRPYRRKGMKTIGASFYKGLVNARLHNGVYNEDELYEYGYVNGGVMAVGYIQYLKKLAKEKNIDQLLFVARDGYIIHKIYEEHEAEVDSAYVPFSRFASYQLTMERNWKNFLRHVVNPRIQADPSEKLGEVIKICDMAYVKPYLDEYGLTEDTNFDYFAYDKIRTLFENHIVEISKCFDNPVRAAEQYLREVIGDHKRICIVDVGWQGSGAMCLKYFLEEKCKMNVQVCGALMGMTNNESSDACLSNGTLHSYMFSPQMNMSMMLKHTAKHNEYDFRNLLVEILFTEDKPSFIKYQFNTDGKVELVYGIDEDNGTEIASVQKGIYDFAMDYFTYERKFGSILNVCGREAYMPVDGLAEDKKYCLKFLGNYRVNENSGIFEKDQKRTLRDIVQENR